MKLTATRIAIQLVATAVLVLLCRAAPGVAATVNFAQSDQTVAPAPADAHTLASYFSPPYHSGPLPPAITAMLARGAPAEIHTGCAATVASWGRGARGASLVSVRILAAANGSVWLAYRCGSGNAGADHMPQSEALYTERLALFNSARHTIQFFGLAASGDTSAALYHVGLAETMKLRGADNSAAFVVFAISSTLQGGSTPARLENRLVVIANSATTAKLALAVVTARNRPSARKNEVEGDSAIDNAEYRAALRFDHDPSGHLTAVNVYYREAPSGGLSHFGVARYVWYPATFRFATAAPILASPMPQHPIRLPPVPGYNPLAN
jgi:hypothetical protein